MTIRPPNKTNKKPSKIPYLGAMPSILMAVFFILVTAADFWLIYLANNNYNGIVTNNAYQKGLDYNNVLNAAKQQEQLGWQDTLEWIPNQGAQEGILRLCLVDADGKYLLTADKVIAQLRHPITDKHDQTVNLMHTAKCYENSVSLPHKGRWEILVHAYIGKVDYYKREIIMVE